MKQVFQKVEDLLSTQLVKQLADQGHRLTGSLENSIINSARIIEGKNRTELFGFALDYAQDLEKGTKKFGRDHVQELYKYFLLRGFNKIQAMEAAVLTNRKHRQEGMPTKASSRFSKTGERKNFIQNTWKENEQKIDSLIDQGTDQYFNEIYNLQKSETI
ncbi:hypothetical protein CHRYSEOSP005_00110 [Chryseobacterium sp. Alg-005]|uniref:hypothetical protein n=1 Tax=Chryseobacterium sp. Alg-005 TaxID=3159516 RepID=UPI003555BDAD